MPDENKSQNSALSEHAATKPLATEAVEDREPSAQPRWLDVLRQAFNTAREEQPATSRRELGRDRRRSFFVLVGAAVVLLVVFLGIFSSPNNSKKATQTRKPGTPDLGRRVTPGESDQNQPGSVIPLLNVENGQTPPPDNDGVSAEEVGRTAKPTPAVTAADSPPSPKPPPGVFKPYALGRIDFPEQPDSARAGNNPPPSPTASEAEILRKTSLVFVRSAPSGPTPTRSSVELEPGPNIAELSVGTRLVARLESAVNSSVKTPLVAAIEYNYERDGQIVVPAGTKAFGTLLQADRSGYVSLQFDSLELPDGTRQRISATGLSLDYGPLKGKVSGRSTSKKFLVRAFTGLGTIASVGAGATGNSLSGALVGDRIATNIALAGDQELSSLAVNENVFVTIPGNTRFYLVVQKPTNESGEARRLDSVARTSNPSLPSAQEFRQFLQWRREMSEITQQSSTPSTPSQIEQ